MIASGGIVNGGQMAGDLKSNPEVPGADPEWMRERAQERAQFEVERTRERAERYDLQNIVNRQTAMHAALMLDPKPGTPAELVTAATDLLKFLTAKD